MANRVKEDEKNEKIIRGLLKLPTNRRCINCNNLVRFFSSVNRGSKKKRQYTHAMIDSPITRAREIYFKDWDPQRHSFPDSRLLLILYFGFL
ncbi:hypothetical protein BHE74_00031760 [Ensete ventricosum]|nr:hypothetical protein BHE74_00031760 [Ensete ventricosum]